MAMPQSCIDANVRMGVVFRRSTFGAIKAIAAHQIHGRTLLSARLVGIGTIWTAAYLRCAVEGDAHKTLSSDLSPNWDDIAASRSAARTECGPVGHQALALLK